MKNRITILLMKNTAWRVLMAAFFMALASCNESGHSELKLTPERSDRSLSTHSQWLFRDRWYDLKFTKSVAVYDFYDEVPKGMSYYSYIREDKFCPYMEDIRKPLEGIAQDEHFSDRDLAECVLAWTQSIPYEKDPPGPREFIRFPILTLLDNRGDCEDHALLFSCTMASLGKPSCLIVIPGQTHMAAGVALDEWDGPYFTGPSGRHYVFAEATWPNTPLGKVSYPSDSVLIYEIDPIVSVTRYAKLEISQDDIYRERNNGWTNPDIVEKESNTLWNSWETNDASLKNKLP
ncbi:MAG: hypothetical protein JSS76_16290 [Bacteroidetes bacterium]|nr:hypothetical protein [Bacteroidota bacterium]